MKQVQELKGMIGLEIHAYLTTKEKLFCSCVASREKGLKGNVNVCPICTGQPGAKPMSPNGEALKKAVAIGLMLGCKINKELIWNRKHYDWPDLPKGYQNTMSGAYVVPLGIGGKFHDIRIRGMHLEEDPASWEPSTGQVDYNRSGLPLVEIITEPDFTNSFEVINWLKKLAHNLAYLKAVDSNAGIKVDVNVSVPGKTERVEIKNISSLDSIGKAIEYEIKRQIEEGNKERQTRRYDEVKGKTVLMRSKESEEDYRFISDPDLTDIVIDSKFISEIEKNIPESPEEKLAKFIKKHKIDKKSAEVLTKNIDVAEFYEKVSEKVDPNFSLPWVTIELLRFLNYNKVSLEGVELDINHFISLLKLVKEGKITELQGKQILNKFYPKSFDPSKKVQEKISDQKELSKIAEIVIKENNKAVDDFKNGDNNALNFLMGKIMEKTERRADFKIAREVLVKLLK